LDDAEEMKKAEALARTTGLTKGKAFEPTPSEKKQIENYINTRKFKV